jgi:nicotinamidase/pyrazinamidase
MPKLGPADAVIAVDVQNDFCPGGALPVPEGDQIVPVLNRWIEAAQAGGAAVVASRDWHPPGHVSFQERGGPWPIHCVQHTPGAEFHPELRLPDDAILVSKGAALDRDNYSAFDETGLAETLRRRGVTRVWIGGLALDVCVAATVEDALREGFETHLLAVATRPVEVQPGDGARTVQTLREHGAIVES